MLNVLDVATPHDGYFATAVPGTVSEVIAAQLVAAGYLAEVLDAEGFLSEEEREAATSLFGRYPTVRDRGVRALVSNYDQAQVAAIADALADDPSFRRAWSAAEGLPGSWLDGVPAEVERERSLLLADFGR